MDLDPGEIAHARARRLKDNAIVHVGDGRGRRWAGSLSWNEKKSARVQLSGMCEHAANGFPIFSLLSAVPKSSRKDWLIEKSTELGLRHFIPAEFHRSVRERISPDRFQKLSREAAAQSETWFLPTLESALSGKEIQTFLRQKLEDGAEVHILDLPDDSDRRFQKPFAESSKVSENESSGASRVGLAEVVIVVGPEGGFSDEDRNLWKSLEQDFSNCNSIQLGPRVLRVETAAISYLSYLSISSVLN